MIFEKMRLIFIPCLLLLSVCRADLLVELQNVPISSNMTLLCEVIMRTYYDGGESDQYCLREDNYLVSLGLPQTMTNLGDVRVYYQSVRFRNRTTTTHPLLMTIPKELNTELRAVGFFERTDGAVSIISNVNTFREHAIGVFTGIIVASFITCVLMLWQTSALF